MKPTIPDLNLPNNISFGAEKLEGFLWGGRETGITWLDRVPAIVNQVCARFEITNLRPSPEMRMNMVLFGESALHGPIVLKLAQPHVEIAREMDALKAFASTGSYARLISADPSAAWMLQERIVPGDMLQSLVKNSEVGDEEGTYVAGHIMRSVMQAAPEGSVDVFPGLDRWLKSLWNHVEHDKGIIDAEQLELAYRYAKHLVQESYQPVLLHGDFHHGNILQGSRGWVLIDPKGVIGPAEFEVGPFFYNPIGVDTWQNLPALFDRRLEIFSETLGIDRARLWRAALVGCVLSDCWTLEDGSIEHTHFNTVTAALMQLPERFA